MNRINKQTKEKLLELAIEYINRQDDSEFSKDEWYDTPKGFATQVLSDFLSELGISLPKEKI